MARKLSAIAPAALTGLTVKENDELAKLSGGGAARRRRRCVLPTSGGSPPASLPCRAPHHRTLPSLQGRAINNPCMAASNSVASRENSIGRERRQSGVEHRYQGKIIEGPPGSPAEPDALQSKKCRRPHDVSVFLPHPCRFLGDDGDNAPGKKTRRRALVASCGLLEHGVTVITPQCRRSILNNA